MSFLALSNLLRTSLAPHRIVVVGGSKCGKSTVSSTYPGTVKHTDDLVEEHDWSGCSDQAARWMAEDGPWLIEGVAGSRALRKALEQTEGRPCDVVIRLDNPVQELSKGQAAMNKGEATVWGKIEQTLIDRGIIIITMNREGKLTLRQGDQTVVV